MVADIKENLDALKELQERRSIKVQPRLTEARPQMLVAQRLLAAPVDTAQEVAPENAVAENAESEKQSQKTATKQGVDFLASRFFSHSDRHSVLARDLFSAELHRAEDQTSFQRAGG